MSLRDLQVKKEASEPITWLTCYDYSFARALSRTDLDLILVGDSGGMALLGYEDTTPVTMDEMIFMCKAVRRGASNKFIVGDMPKGSYEILVAEAVKHAMRFCKEGNTDAVKLEGGSEVLEQVRHITLSGIPVIGHLGLTPQSTTLKGGYRVVGRTPDEAASLIRDAQALQEAGAIALLLEAVPDQVASQISSSLRIPVLGIGSGSKVDGQLLILHDLLGLYPDMRPKFAKCYVPSVLGKFSEHLNSIENLIDSGRSTRNDGLLELTVKCVEEYVNDVKAGLFPSRDYTYAP